MVPVEPKNHAAEGPRGSKNSQLSMVSTQLDDKRGYRPSEIASKSTSQRLPDN